MSLKINKAESNPDAGLLMEQFVLSPMVWLETVRCHNSNGSKQPLTGADLCPLFAS